MTNWFNCQEGLNSLFYEQLLNCFISEGDWLLDPFTSNTELFLAANKCKLNSVGVGDDIAEVKNTLFNSEKQTELLKNNQTKQILVEQDPIELNYFWQQYQLPLMDLVITNLSWDLKRYSETISDLGSIFLRVKEKMKDGAYLVIVTKNYFVDSEYYPFVFDLVNKLKSQFNFKKEIVCCLGESKNFSYDYDVDSYYVLVFRK
jgi:hypothetical protein